MDIREQIGNRITKARKELGITIKELAERTAELSPARISNWEQGTRSPGPMEAKLLADQLNVSAAYLLCLTDNP
ncbi:helix-turn-helix domain-containing protein, partial [Legionella pneumophila]